MVDTTTTNYGFTKPGVLDPTGTNAWGPKLNTNFDQIDAAIFATDYKVSTVGDSNAVIPAGTNSCTIGAITAPRTYTLPAASSLKAGREFVITDTLGIVTPTNTVSLVAAGSDKINGVASTILAINAAYNSCRLRSDGSANWTILFDAALVKITGGTIDGTVIGGVTPAAGHFTGLSASSGVSVSGSLGLWTTEGWGKSLDLTGPAYAIRWPKGAGANSWGIGSTSGGIGLSFTYSTADDNSQPAVHPLVINAGNPPNAVFSGDVSMLSQNGGQLAGFRNLIINGSFEIDQRNAGAVGVVSGSNGWLADRWIVAGTQTNKLQTQAQVGTALTLGMTRAGYVLVATAVPSLAASDAFNIQHKIEGWNSARLGWGGTNGIPATLSFIAYSTVAGTYAVALRNSAANRSYVFTITLAATTWTLFKVTIPPDTTGTWAVDNTTGIQLVWSLGAGTNYNAPAANAWQAGNYFSIAGTINFMATASAQLYLSNVQLEAGSVATPYEQRLIGTELMLCLRYYRRFVSATAGAYWITGYAGAIGNSAVMTVSFDSMRASPTAALIGSWTLNNTSAVNINATGSLNTVQMWANATAVGFTSVLSPANGGFDLNAEL